jgi:maltose/moltooligosaccharide transporter
MTEDDSVSVEPVRNPKIIQNKLNVKATFLVGFGFLSVMLAWMVYNFQMPIILAGKLADNGIDFERVGMLGTGAERLFFSGFIMTLDNIVAISLQPWFGKLSDRLESKYGRRTPFMMIGIPIAALSLIILPFTELISVFAVLFVSFIGIVVCFNLAMAFYRAPIVALLADKTPAKFRSTGNAIINLMGGVGTGVGFLVPIAVTYLGFVKDATIITGVFETQNFLLEDFVIFTVTAVLIVIVLILFLTLVREEPTGKKFWHLANRPILFDSDTLTVIPQNNNERIDGIELKTNSIIADLKGLFQEKDKSGVFILLAIFCWFFGFNALDANFSRWTQEYLLLEGALVGRLFLALPIALAIVGVPAAKIAEKAGRRKTIKLGLIFMITALSLMIIVQEVLRAEVEGGLEPNILGLAAGIGFMGVGWAFININSIPIVWQLAPKDKIGSYTGLYYLASQLAAILSPTLIGFFFMIGEFVLGTSLRVYTWRIMLPFMLISMIAAFFCMTRVKRGEAEISKEEMDKLKEKFSDSD